MIKYFLYRIDENAEAEIYGRFESLSAAKMSADLLMIKDFCFILSGDMKKMYFYEDNKWDYDILTEQGKFDFIECFPDPHDYVEE